VDVLLDGAHNPAGAAALATALDDLRPLLASGRATVVTASMADKDVDGIVTALAKASALGGARVIATQVDVPRALPAGELARRWAAATEPGWTVSTEADASAAIGRAIDEANGPVIIAGSLYLVGVARGRLVDDPLLRDPAPVAAAR
jgi:dihydrofolate synthase/folylpolyglutamate synthase